MSYPTPGIRKFGAKGGVANDGPALQLWLDDIAGKSGTLDRHYLTAQNLVPHPGTTIYGVGNQACGIGAHPSFPVGTQPLLSLSSGVRLFNIGMRGTPELREAYGGAMVSLVGDDILLHGCAASWWRTLLAAAATNRLKITDCDLGHWGDSIMLPERNSIEGQAIIAANAALHPDDRKPEDQLALRGQQQDDGGYAVLGGNGTWPNADVEVSGGTIHDGKWAAIDCMQPNNVRWSITNLQILRITECGIYCGVSAIIDHVTGVGLLRRDSSAQWIEGSGVGTRITNCTFGRPDGPIIFATNPRGLYIARSVFFDPMEEARADNDVTPWSAAIFARNTPAPPELLADGFTVEDNDIANERGKASYLLSMYDGGGGPFHNVDVGRNRTYGRWKGGVLAEGPGVRGKSFVVSQTIGAHV